MIIGLVAEGDSITQSTQPGYFYLYLGVDRNNVILNHTSTQYQTTWCARYHLAQTVRATAVNIIGANRAIGGSRLYSNGPNAALNYPGDLTFRADLQDALLSPNVPGRPDIFTVMIGTNPDISNANEFAAMVGAYCAARKAAGWNLVLVGTLLPRGDGIIGGVFGDPSAFETYRQGYNSIIRTSAWQMAWGVDGIFDFGADPIMGAIGALTDTSLFQTDQIHPTDYGQRLLATIYVNAVNGAIASLFPPLPAPVLLSAASRMTHGSAGTFDLPLPLDGSGIEPRSDGTGNYTILLNFDQPVTVGMAKVISGDGIVNAVTFSDNSMLLSVSDVSDEQMVTISTAGVAGPGTEVASPSLNLGFLVGDANGDGLVNSADVSLTKSQSGNAITGSNFRQDVNVDGTINSSDVALVKSKSGSSLP